MNLIKFSKFNKFTTFTTNFNRNLVKQRKLRIPLNREQTRGVFSAKPVEKRGLGLSRIGIIIGGVVLGAYGAYHLIFPNISLFPPDARELLRKALWAKNRHADYPTAIEYYLKAIDVMRSNADVDQTSSYYIGTLLELANVYELNKQWREANKQYYNCLELLAPKSIYHKPKDIGLSSSLPAKNKLKVVGLFQKLAHNYGELAVQNPADKMEYLATQEQYLCSSLEVILVNSLANSVTSEFSLDGEGSKINPETSLPYNFPSPRYPKWIPREEIVCCFERLADFYRANNQVRLSLPLYYSAIILNPAPEILAQLWCNLGSCQFKLKHYETAKISLLKGIQTLEASGCYTNDQYHTMSVLKYNLAFVHEVNNSNYYKYVNI
jgi:tetratricopeptide (TPR) repeat protein